MTGLEALAEARPDLLIDAVQPEGTLHVASQLAEIAPVVGLNLYRPIETIAAPTTGCPTRWAPT